MAPDKTTRATATASGSLAVLEITGDVTDGSERAIEGAYQGLHSRSIKKTSPQTPFRVHDIMGVVVKAG